MARIEGIDLPRSKRVEIGLTYIYGIGLKTSHEILEHTQISPDTRIQELTEQEVARLREYIHIQSGWSRRGHRIQAGFRGSRFTRAVRQWRFSRPPAARHASER